MLTAKQEVFVREYLVDLNGTAAALRAGYSPRRAPFTASELLKKPKVAAALEKAMKARAEHTELTANMVLQELRKIGFAVTGVKDRDRIAALHLLGKHLGLFVDRKQIEHSGLIEIQNAAREV